MPKRSKKQTRIDNWLAETSTPVFVLDAERTIVGFNAGCELLTGWAAAEVIGQTCPYAAMAEGSGVQLLTAALCPPPEAWQGEAVTVPAFVPGKESAAHSRVLQFFPLLDDQGTLRGIAGVILPRAAARAVPTMPAWELHAELAALRMTLRTRFGPNSLVASSTPMRRVLAQIDLARQCVAHVLLTGETGTGREHLARMIHLGSPNKATAFVPLDCRRLGADELERVLHRLLDVHARRSATTAAGLQPGTLYLAEVNYLPRDLQEQLVRGFSSETPAEQHPNLRLMASLAGPAETALGTEKLRDDFFALVAPLVIALPPLRDRAGDLPLLAQYFLEESNRLKPQQIGGFADDVWPLFTRYHWPGNLDELSEVVQQAHRAATETLIRPADLPARFHSGLAAHEVPPPAELPSLSLDLLLEKLEVRLITLALQRSRFNKSRAAELLGINRQRLLRRIEQLKIADPTASADEETAPSEPEPA